MRKCEKMPNRFCPLAVALQFFSEYFTENQGKIGPGIIGRLRGCFFFFFFGAD